MKTVGTFFAALALAASAAAFALPAPAAEFTKGVVKKIDTKAKKVTIDHEDLKNLDMPAMTMVFRVGDDAVLAKLKEGASIEFVADRVNGKLTVTEVK
ncbi:copper-binding protein [Ensifer sp. ENS12]|uniref:copper-binding protein n=1 Tax=Ensifer sp. ENS12 TaxID=2854774 RepID=UPI001C460935|nr:copper-binding protein [Ensifer sp. ENS12]MBV7518225.1 copper-binding protein [Ensifer sp. ENS12]